MFKKVKKFNFPHLLSLEPFHKRLMLCTIYVFGKKEKTRISFQVGEKMGKDQFTGLASILRNKKSVFVIIYKISF